MDKIILGKSITLIAKLLVIYSVYILLRGHNEPGGGFIGGLLLALGFILRGYSYKQSRWRQGIIAHFPQLIGVLALLFAAVLLVPALMDQAILTGLWSSIWVPIAGKFSSVLVFDTVVYLMVAGSAIYAHHALCPYNQKDAP